MNRPARIAIVGAGPAGFYCAQHLLDRRDLDVEIDLFDRLPAPGGLVRYGVAPDHPEKKLIGEGLFRLLLARPELRFLGHVEIGAHLQPAELRAWYDAVVFSSGADGEAPLGIPGEGLAGSVAAHEFVGWYNGRPDQRRPTFDLACERAVIFGAGNVALDVARMLTLPPQALARTDIASAALDVLRESRVREVVVAARRGWRRSAFHAPEFEELLEMDDVELVVDGVAAEDVAGDEADFNQRLKNRILHRIRARRVAAPRKRIVFRYLVSPLALQGEGGVRSVLFGRNRLTAEDRAEPTGETFALEAGLVVRATGLRGRAVAGLPFDADRGLIPNAGGRVLADDGAVMPGVYAAGWIKRGPSGVIGSNKKCAGQSMSALIADLGAAPAQAERPSAAWVRNEIARRQPHLVLLQDWLAIDRAEKQAGRARRKPREKFTDVDAMLRQALCA